MNRHSVEKTGKNQQPTGSVIVLYENPSARELAVQFCEQLERQAGPSNRLLINWYSFEYLTVPQNAEQVVQAATNTDLLAFAVSSQGELPPPIKTWTEHWLVRRGEREGSLVGLLLEAEGGPSGLPGLKEIYLRHLAHRAGMDYLSHFPGQIRRAIPNSLDSFNQRAGRISPVLDEILHTHFVPPSLPLN